nr:MAG TPA: hypothetical protein [Caudoviricetes sp.]
MLYSFLIDWMRNTNPLFCAAWLLARLFLFHHGSC